MCRLMTHRRSVKIGLEFWNRIRNEKYGVHSKYEQIWANMSFIAIVGVTGEKGDWGLEIGNGAFICFANVFYLTILKVLFIFKSAQLLRCNGACNCNCNCNQLLRCNVPWNWDYFHLIKILKYIVIIDWNKYIVIIQLCVYELRMLSPSFCIQRSQCNCSYCCFQLSEM